MMWTLRVRWSGTHDPEMWSCVTRQDARNLRARFRRMDRAATISIDPPFNFS